jgi:hypothetical protein
MGANVKCYKDLDGNYLCSDNVIFEDKSDEDTYMNDWNLSREEYYKKILKENQYIASQDFDYYF